MAHSIYILISHGDCKSVWATTSREQAIGEAQDAFLSWFWDFERARIQRGDIILASECSTEWRVVEVAYSDLQESVSEVELPFQEWINEALREHRIAQEAKAAVEADPEWAEYQRLQEKFRGRW